MSVHGVDYMDTIKAAFPNIPVILVSMNQSTDSVIRIFKKGAKDCFQPPFFGEVVKAKINIILENSIYRRRMISSHKIRETEKIHQKTDRQNIAELIRRVEVLQTELKEASEEHKKLQGFVTAKDEELNKEKMKSTNFAKLIMGAMSSSGVNASNPPALLSKLAEVDKEKDNSNNQNVVNDVKEMTQRMAKAAETPIQSITRTVGEILREDKNLTKVEHRRTLANVITSLSSDDMYQPHFQKLFKECTVDDATRQWILEEFDTNQRFLKSTKSSTNLDYSSSFAALTDTTVLKTWDFNIFAFSQDAIISFVESMFKEFGLLERFKIDTKIFTSFVEDIKLNSKSDQIPYHNFMHAFDVLQTVFLFLTKTDVTKYLTRLDIYALLIGGLCQDIDHPGLNNLYQINAQTPLALTYNDISVLENFHATRTFAILGRTQLLKTLTLGEFQEFRRNVIAGILGTDMSSHFSSLTKLATHIETKPFSRESSDDRQLLIVTILHAADLSNACKQWRICKRWCDLMQEEYFKQGDEETKHTLPQSPYMIRSTANMPKMMLNMIDYVVYPLYSTLSRLFPDLQVCLQNIQANRLQFAQECGDLRIPEIDPNYKPQSKEENDGRFAGDPDHEGTDEELEDPYTQKSANIIQPSINSDEKTIYTEGNKYDSLIIASHSHSHVPNNITLSPRVVGAKAVNMSNSLGDKFGQNQISISKPKIKPKSSGGKAANSVITLSIDPNSFGGGGSTLSPSLSQNISQFSVDGATSSSTITADGSLSVSSSASAPGKGAKAAAAGSKSRARGVMTVSPSQGLPSSSSSSSSFSSSFSSVDGAAPSSFSSSSSSSFSSSSSSSFSSSAPAKKKGVMKIVSTKK
jgi:hypothetical protein